MKKNQSNNQQKNIQKHRQKTRSHLTRRIAVQDSRAQSVYRAQKRDLLGKVSALKKFFGFRQLRNAVSPKEKDKNFSDVENIKSANQDLHSASEYSKKNAKKVVELDAKPSLEGKGQSFSKVFPDSGEIKSSSDSYSNNSRTAGIVAAILLFAMLAVAIIPTSLSVRAEEQAEIASLNPSMQLAKEYIYAGSRMLAVEDYGLGTSSSPTPTPTPTETPTVTPTPTPTPATPTPTPETPTPTPTPAPAVPSIASVTANADPTCLDITLNGVSGADSYNVKLLLNGHTVNVTSLSFPWCGLSPATYYEYQAQAVNQYGTSAWSNTVGGTTANPLPTPTPVPESYTLTTYQPGSRLFINWSASTSRPSQTDKITVSPDNNSSVIEYERYTMGGTSGQVSVTAMLAPGGYIARYMKDGTMEVATNTFTISP